VEVAKIALKPWIMNNYFVYILACSDNKPYTGCSANLKERLEQHRKGRVLATKKRLPVKLISYIAFNDKYKAFEFEKYLKSGSGRAFFKRHF
jgi:predicted GIY-YIG superfamily endonuclease